MPKNPIIIFCAHSDDQIFGVGGTVARYAKEGKDVYTIIFSYGESTHFWLKRHISAEMRVKESQNADKVIGGKGVIFLGLTEGKFREGFKEWKLDKRVATLIKKIKPTKIFTHSEEDPHPDHKSVHDLILETMDKMKYKCDVYSFDIWNPIRIKKRDQPKLIVDITDTFKLKIKTLKCFKSQRLSLFSLLPSVYIKAITNGYQNHVKYAEAFTKER